MTHATTYRGADTTTRPKGPGNATLPTINKIVLHTTEGNDGLPSYTDNWPNLTYDPWHRKWYQHTPINGSSTSLRNDGTHQTNRANVVQVEIMATCDPARHTSPFHVSRISQAALGDLGAFVAWINTEWEVPIVAAAKWVATANTTSVRMSWNQYTAFHGVLGHQHVPGNTHYDPGALNIDAIIDAAVRQHNQPDPDTECTLMNLNCQWPGFASTKETARPWTVRCPQLAHTIHTAGPSVVTTQELGHDEAADLAEALGNRWHYQRNGLNTVLWRDEWTLDEPSSRNWNLSSFGQMQRTLIACKLRHHTGSYVWAASTHLAAKASDLTADQAINARHAQARQIATILDSYRQIVLGADLNSNDHDTLTGAPRAVLRADGWTTDTQAVTIGDLNLDTKGGIDAILTKKRCHIHAERIVPLGAASDHDARLATLMLPRAQAGSTLDLRQSAAASRTLIPDLFTGGTRSWSTPA